MANVSKIKLPNNSSLDVKALAIPIGTVASTSTSTAFTFTVPGITSLYDGVIFAIRNTVVASASGWTVDVNGLGAKQVYGSNNSRITTGFAKNYWYIFIYDEANSRWTLALLTDANSTYSNASLGQGYGTCTTAAETTAKAVTLSSYALTAGGIVAVKFDNDVPANATMNINSKGAKAIYHRGAAITAGVIKGGDIAYFIYSTYYHLLGVDRIISKVSDLTNDAGYTTNIGTITGITMNGVSKGTSGVVDLGTVVTSDEKVKQSPSTDNSAFEVLLSGTADNTERTEITKKSSTLKYNPSTKALVTGGTVDGYTLNAAAGKAVDSSIAAGSTSTNLPTSAAVASALSGKQDTLVSGTNIKTINSQSVLGSGNIALNGGNINYTGEDGDVAVVNGEPLDTCLKDLDDAVLVLQEDKQNKLISGTNIKTINNNSLLGSGNISVGTVTGSNLTANQLILGNGGTAIKRSDYIILPSGETYADDMEDYCIPTIGYLEEEIEALPEPMIFKGTLGTGGTITSLPAAAIGNTGYTYKVITDGTYQSIAAKAGDTFISNGSSWTLIPSGDEPSGTVTNIATGTGLTGGPITTTGTVAIDTDVVATKSDLEDYMLIEDYETDEEVIAAAINDLNDKIASKQNTISDLDTIRNNAAAGAAKVSNVQSDWNATSGAAVILNKPSIPEGNAKIFYGTCDTAAATTAKVVTCADFTSSDLVKGALIFVTFDYTNTGAVANITLNVNDTGAKNIKKQASNSSGGSTSNLAIASELQANNTYLFQYNDTYWVCMTNDHNTNTTYTSMSASEATTGTATSARSISAKVLAGAIEERIVTMTQTEVTSTINTIFS